MYVIWGWRYFYNAKNISKPRSCYAYPVCGRLQRKLSCQPEVIHLKMQTFPDSKVQGANMGPTWVLSAPDGPHVAPMNLAIRVLRLLAPNADDVESTTLLPINHIPLYETTSRPHTMSLYLRDICTLSVYLRTICHQRQSIMLDNGCWFLCRTWIVWMRGVARPRLPSKDGWCWV